MCAALEAALTLISIGNQDNREDNSSQTLSLCRQNAAFDIKILKCLNSNKKSNTEIKMKIVSTSICLSLLFVTKALVKISLFYNR